MFGAILLTEPMQLLVLLRSNVTRHFGERPIRLIRLSDMKVLTRDQMINDTITEIISESSGGWNAGDLSLQMAQKGAYAILSHRWGASELTLADTAKLNVEASTSYAHFPADRNLALRKILSFCAKAVDPEYGCRYAWFDSGCIDQSNKAELDESVPAMFKWYQNATICIVYLASTRVGASRRRRVTDDVWFTRGWTLQEFLASRRLKFYDAQWQPLTEQKLDIDRATSWVYLQKSGGGEFSSPLSGFNPKKMNIDVPKVFGKNNLRAAGEHVFFASHILYLGLEN